MSGERHVTLYRLEAAPACSFQHIEGFTSWHTRCPYGSRALR
jgi:hypothetical protein